MTDSARPSELLPEVSAMPEAEAMPEASQIHGIVPPMVTPLASPDSIDELGLRRLVEHLIEGGVHGLFILGTTGEGPSLPQSLRRDLITLTCKFVDRRLPVLVGLTECIPGNALELGAVAAGEGAAATVLAPPYYFPLTQQELGDYAEGLAAQLELPLMLYNMPGLTKVWYKVETLRRLTQVESIIGLKDSSGDLKYFEAAVQLKQLRPDWSLLVGPEHLLSATLQLGGDGGVNGGAHLFPRLFVNCYEAARRGELNEAARLQAGIQEVQACYAVGGEDPQRFLKVPKHGLALMDICSDLLAPPLQPLAADSIERLRVVIGQLAEQQQEQGLCRGPAARQARPGREVERLG